MQNWSNLILIQLAIELFNDSMEVGFRYVFVDSHDVAPYHNDNIDR